MWVCNVWIPNVLYIPPTFTTEDTLSYHYRVTGWYKEANYYTSARNSGHYAPLFLVPVVGWEPMELPAGGPLGPQQMHTS